MSKAKMRFLLFAAIKRIPFAKYRSDKHGQEKYSNVWLLLSHVARSWLKVTGRIKFGSQLNDFNNKRGVNKGFDQHGYLSCDTPPSFNECCFR